MNTDDQVLKQQPLSNYTTMRVGGPADFLVEVDDIGELVEVTDWATEKNLPVMVLGEGANTIFTSDGYRGLVVINKLEGLKVLEETDEYTIIEAASGELWDDLVSFTVDKGLTGIEALSLIPGTVGAAPVQNIGAYGQEFASVFHKLEAYDTAKSIFVHFDKEKCDFSYRNSIFKPSHPDYEKGRYIITSVQIKLSPGQLEGPFYTTLQKYLDENNISDYTPKHVRDAVVAWRSEYLPDPSIVANSGSFFANPIIDKQQLDEIINNNPSIADHPTQWYWETSEGKFKVAVGRLAEMANLKDYHDSETKMGTWKNSSLIFVNEDNASYDDFVKFRAKYLKIIKDMYGIDLIQEPDLIEN